MHKGEEGCRLIKIRKNEYGRLLSTIKIGQANEKRNSNEDLKQKEELRNMRRSLSLALKAVSDQKKLEMREKEKYVVVRQSEISRGCKK